MSMEDRSEPLPFRDDFAARVLLAADWTTAHRRRVRWIGVTMAASIVAAVFVVAPWRGTPSVSSVRPAAWQIAANAEPDLSTLGPTAASTQSDPLGYMFPDAEPLSRFSSQYASDTTGGQDSGIFSDEVEEAGGS